MNTMTREVTGVEVTETMDYWYDIVTRKEYRVKVIRRVGPHQVEDQDGNLVQVTESVTFEASPPMGTPVIYIDGEKAVKADLVVEVTQTTESNGDKEYPLTITKWSGLHEIQDRQGRTVRRRAEDGNLQEHDPAPGDPLHRRREGGGPPEHPARGHPVPPGAGDLVGRRRHVVQTEEKTPLAL